MSSSVISCGFFMSSLFFSSLARFAAVRFFCSIDRGPNLHRSPYQNVSTSIRDESSAEPPAAMVHSVAAELRQRELDLSCPRMCGYEVMVSRKWVAFNVRAYVRANR